MSTRLRHRRMDLRTHLLDRQIIDADGFPVGVVEEVQISDGQRPRIAALFTGRALLNRLSSGVPRVDLLDRIDADDIGHIGTVVGLTATREELSLSWTEDWVGEHIIDKIPGARR